MTDSSSGFLTINGFISPTNKKVTSSLFKALIADETNSLLKLINLYIHTHACPVHIHTYINKQYATLGTQHCEGIHRSETEDQTAHPF